MMYGRALATLAILLIAGSPLGPPPADAQQMSVTGTLHLLWPDAPQALGSGGPIYVVVDDAGEWVRLDLRPDQLRTMGGPSAVTGRRVTVSGRRISQRPPELAVSSIRALDGLGARGFGAPGAAVTGSQPWVTILCRFGDSVSTTPHPPSWFEPLFGTSRPGLDHFWREVSYDAIDIVGSQIVGWYDLPEPRSYYVYDQNGDGNENLDFGRAVEDCTGAADADVFFPDFVGVNLLFNQDLDCCAWGGAWTLSLDGETTTYNMTWMPPWGYDNQNVMAHEMGHGFGLPHSRGPGSYGSQWDVMSGGGTCSAPDPEYGCVAVHTITYHKDRLAWIPAARTYQATLTSSATLSISRLSQPVSTTDLLMAEIPMPTAPDPARRFYTVEVRRPVGYDGQIPGDAVVIHAVDLAVSEPAEVVDGDGDGDVNDEGGQWLPGEQYVDPANGIQVEVIGATETGYEVEVSLGIPIVTITGPADLSDFAPGTAIEFAGSAEDYPDGPLSGTSLVWSSDLDGELGTGATLTRDDLSRGTHTITLTATDSEGFSDDRSITIEVLEPPTLTPSAAELALTAVEGTSPGTRTLRIDNEGGATLNWSASVEQSWLRINPLSGSVAGGDSQEIDLVPTLSGLPVGRYSTEIAFEANTSEPPSPVTVTLDHRPDLAADEAASALVGWTMIESEVSDYLDGIGNANGRYDVGDFVAWLDLLEGRAPAATVARDLEVTGATEEEEEGR